MKTLIVPLTKSPNKNGRYGDVYKQDWYRGIKKAKDLALLLPFSSICFLSNFACDKQSEMEIYCNAASDIGISETLLRKIPYGYETIGQVEYAGELAKQENAKIIFISTLSHFPRVWWICKRAGITAQHKIVFGIPRPMEIITDIVLIFLYPVIDLLGKKSWFQNKLIQHRKEGKL